jgi:hypothetical protein
MGLFYGYRLLRRLEIASIGSGRRVHVRSPSPSPFDRWKGGSVEALDVCEEMNNECG